MKSHISGLNGRFHVQLWHSCIAKSFLLTIAIFAVAPAIVHSQTAVSNEVATDSSDGNREFPASQKTSDWKQRHAERMKLNKSLASRIDKVIKMTERTRIVDELRATAAELPKDSRHAQLIQDTAKEIATVEKDAGKLLTDDLTERLKSLSKQLSFQPKMESKLPTGFPAPTPVGEIEVKSYPTYRMAKTSSSGSGNSSFFRLFEHIQSKQIAMTAPVEMTYDESKSGFKETEMAFLYGDPSIGATNGEGEVQVVDVSPRKAIVLGMRGRPTEQRIAEVVRVLREHAKVIASGFTAAEAAKVFGYNSPSIPAENQFYEVLLELQPKSGKAQ